MEADDDMSPGRRDYWDNFYDPEGGPLSDKERALQRRRAKDDKDMGTSVLDHYEWFTTWEFYGPLVWKAIASSLFVPSRPVTRMLHVGCGNSDFSDHCYRDWAHHVGGGGHGQEAVKSRDKRKSGKRSECSAVGSSSVEIVNTDICATLVERLQQVYPSRIYIVGDCCDMCASLCQSNCFDTNNVRGNDGRWWMAEERSTLRMLPGSVDIVFDKGTMDAILSAFPGSLNPNAQRYASEVLRSLCVGGLFILLSINSDDVLAPYFYSADCSCDGQEEKSFEKTFCETIDVSDQFVDADDSAASAMRVETLGVRYTMYAYRVRV